MKPGDPSLDQLRIFLEVVEQASFGAAAKAMGRAVSGISYGIAQSEAQLAVTLFDREGSRRPVLTKAGKGLMLDLLPGEVPAKVLREFREIFSDSCPCGCGSKGWVQLSHVW
jgi:hypothetical protein